MIFKMTSAGTGHAAFVVVPGPDRDAQSPGHLGSAAVSVQIRNATPPDVRPGRAWHEPIQGEFSDEPCSEFLQANVCQSCSASGAKRIGTRDRAPRAI